jgi:hypothetical protein
LLAGELQQPAASCASLDRPYQVGGVGAKIRRRRKSLSTLAKMLRIFKVRLCLMGFQRVVIKPTLHQHIYMRCRRVFVIGPCYAPNTALVGASNRGVSGRIVANEQTLP